MSSKIYTRKKSNYLQYKLTASSGDIIYSLLLRLALADLFLSEWIPEESKCFHSNSSYRNHNMH